MDIVTYRKEKGLSQAAFAALLTGTGAAATQGLVSQWENRTTAIRAERAIQIELATGGVVSRYDLLPHVFGLPPVARTGAISAPTGLGVLVDSRMSKRALRAKLGLSSDLHLAKVLHLPVEQVSGWADEDMVPPLPQVMKLLGHPEQQELAKPANEDPDADRIVSVEVA
ncbi:transcriptional regulator [Stenotrophomonas muris]|uniref:transcriptional regulator n=1 Tax=Stenotrophomonas muris TaxID=2963283 RepID=UPI003F829CA6